MTWRKQARDCAFVVVAAGRGERAGAPHEGPKQYRPIGGKAVIRHALEAILAWPRSGTIVVVIHPDDEALLVNAVAGMPGAERLTIVHGGLPASIPCSMGSRRSSPLHPALPSFMMRFAPS